MPQIHRGNQPGFHIAVRPDQRPREYGRGRRCAEPNCGTILSRYHSGDYCYPHEPDEPSKGSGS